jgi:multidrug transporter EmrE-like cation transporter
MIKLIAVAFAILSNVAAQLCLRKGMMKLADTNLGGGFILNVIASPMVWAGLLLYSLSFAAYLIVLSRFEVNYIYPIIMSLGLVLISIASTILLKESMTLQKIIGSSVILAGVIILLWR